MTREAAHDLSEDVAEALAIAPGAEAKRGPREAGKFLHNYMLFVGVCGNVWPYVQAGKIISEGSAQDISLAANLIVFWALSSWLWYGIAIRSAVLIAANIVGVLGSGMLVVVAYLYG